MNLADPATVQAFETTVVNNNFLAIEGGFTADRNRLTTVEGRATAIEGGITSGGLFVFSVADLDALPSAGSVSEGRRLHVDSMGCDFQVQDGAWVQATVAVFSSTANRDTEYAKASAVYRTQGARCQVGTRMYTYAGTKWHRDGFITPMVSSSTGTSATVDSDGIVQLTAVTAVAIEDVDATLFGGDEWELVIEGTSLAGAITMQLAASGSAASATGNHDFFGNGENQASTDTAVTALAQASWPVSNGQNPVEFSGAVRFRNAASASRKTRGRGHFEIVTTADTAKLLIDVAMDHRAAAAYDGVAIAFGSAFTGSLTVRRLG